MPDIFPPKNVAHLPQKPSVAFQQQRSRRVIDMNKVMNLEKVVAKIKNQNVVNEVARGRH